MELKILGESQLETVFIMLFLNNRCNRTWNCCSIGPQQSLHALQTINHECINFTNDYSTNYFWLSYLFSLAKLGLAATFPGIVIAHIILGTPFVVITVTATLSGFDDSITRAASSLGSTPTHAFFKITLPLITPGIISGALFAFVTSFDEIVVILFVAGGDRNLTTIPLQMWTGLREQLSPTIMAVATCLIVLSTLILIVTELLRRRSERIRGISAQ